MKIQHDRLSPQFEFWALFYGQPGAPNYFHGRIHHLTGADKGEPHSHPFHFRSTILQGGYTERIYTIWTDGLVTTNEKKRNEGDTFLVQPDTVHEIIDLPQGECWTVIVPQGPPPVDWHFWKFDETGVYRRLPEEDQFTKVNFI